LRSNRTPTLVMLPPSRFDTVTPRDQFRGKGSCRGIRNGASPGQSSGRSSTGRHGVRSRQVAHMTGRPRRICPGMSGAVAISPRNSRGRCRGPFPAGPQALAASSAGVRHSREGRRNPVPASSTSGRQLDVQGFGGAPDPLAKFRFFFFFFLFCDRVPAGGSQTPREVARIGCRHWWIHRGRPGPSHLRQGAGLIARPWRPLRAQQAGRTGR